MSEVEWDYKKENDDLLVQIMEKVREIGVLQGKLKRAYEVENNHVDRINYMGKIIDKKDMMLEGWRNAYLELKHGLKQTVDPEKLEEELESKDD